MSINTALSGLSAAQHDIAATSHNIANVGTIGFRGSRAEFADVFNSSPYSISRTAVGSGVQTLRTAMQFSQGSVVATGNTLDLAIEGQGFFATEPAVGPNSAKPEPIYTRAGAFGLNAQGVAVNASGQKLLAWPVSVEGDALSQVPGSATPLTIPLTMGSPVATSTVALSVDLPTDDAMLGKQAAVPPAAAFDPADPTTYAAVTAVPIFDAKGNAVEAAAYFIKTANPTPGNPQTGWAVRLVVAGEPLTPAQGDLTFDATGALSGGTGALSFTAASGIGYTLDLTETELADRSFEVNTVSQDGKSASALTSLEVDASGTVWAAYGAGSPVAMGQVVLVTFANPQALRQLGASGFAATADSGQPVAGTAGDSGFGIIRAGALEHANVDLTEELVHLITAQRNYQASAKAMETSNSLMQTIMNIRS
ncbi:flagellar hook protein FlgE [Cereibacter sphaeroides f. sp. denitrificans]|uniref:flagellar hook protein FlgE n=1 Tax=Cereibacter johrii TaxID=445629 RepID=UPI000E1CB27A|nr:flagellar hook protein FlgE [Cereibacter johrii]MEA5160869.1 flagellar hook protein FlgE [Cereibacter johrii]RDS94365.1 flagellar hook protein FlgE [Cereibacter sphaeroides f. sp. denitrificans]